AGVITLRVSKSGYDLAEVILSVTGNETADIALRKTSGTPAPAPNPNPQPGPNGPTCDAAAYPSSVSCGKPSAVCNDNTFSCSANRSGTCSSHSGVKCWLCPGTLCNPLLAPSSEPILWTPIPLSAGGR